MQTEAHFLVENEVNMGPQPDNYTLANGTALPRLGLGVWRAEGAQVREAVSFALQNGYRMIDTASRYENERQVGEGLRESGIRRDEVFITSKVWIDDAGYEQTMRAYQDSVTNIGVDYLDMYMVHWPVIDVHWETWRALETLYSRKLVKAIGVCNYPAALLRQMKGRVAVMPMVNQVEFHPLYWRGDILSFCEENDILVQAWAPIARGGLNEDPILTQIALKYGKTVPQVILRWEVQLGLSVIPKSVREERIIENSAIFDFALSDEEMQAIRRLDRQQTQASPAPAGVVAEGKKG